MYKGPWIVLSEAVLVTMQFAAWIFGFSGWPIGATNDLRLPEPPMLVRTQLEQHAPNDANTSPILP